MFPFNNESEGECRTPAWQKKRQRQGQTEKKTYKKGKEMNIFRARRGYTMDE